MLPCLTIGQFDGILGGAFIPVSLSRLYTWMGYIQASIDSLFLRDIATGY